MKLRGTFKNESYFYDENIFTVIKGKAKAKKKVFHLILLILPDFDQIFESGLDWTRIK